MRASSRTPLPDLALLLEETNLLLATNGLPTCHALAPVSDGDTANPVVVAHSSERKYVVKVTERHAETWLYARSMGVLEQNGAPGPGRDELDAAAIRRYIDARLPALAVTAIPSPVKADQDLRDFLADPEEYQITGMLDWERVTRGDGIFAITLIYLRLWLNAKLDGWADFYATYNRRATKQAEQCPQAEFYLMCRAVLAYEFNDSVARLVEQLLEGERLPFEGA